MSRFNDWKITFIALVVLLLVSTACAAGEAGAVVKESANPETRQVSLKISGSGSTTAVLAAVAAAFEADTPGYNLETLSGSGTGGGVKGVLEGVLDVAAMARPPKDSENVEFVEIGQAGQAVITHPDVGIDNLDAAQIEGIFMGEISNWSEVGGPDMPIILYVRDEDDSSTKALREVIVGDTPFPDTVARVLTSQGDMLAAVEGTPGSVGIGTWPTALANEAKVSVLSVDGVAPGDAAFPMVSTLGIGYVKEDQAQIQPLIDWLNSENGQAALRKLDVIVAQ